MNSEILQPFSRSWKAPTAFNGVLELGKVRANYVALDSECLLSPDARIQTIASSTRLAYRARIELIRKAALAEARMQGNDRLYRELDPSSGDPRGSVTAQQTFASSAVEENLSDVWEFCRKSGVAVHVDPAAGCAIAWNDLVLSDRVLRSWYGGTPPRFWTRLDNLGPDYTTEEYHFLGSTPQDSDPVITVGVFAFASEALVRQGMPPFLFGFGASQGKDSALQRAYEKLLALAASLTMPQGALKKPIPAWITSEEGVRSARAWLSGNRSDRNAPSLLRPVLECEPSSDALFIDITPSGLLEPVSVVRAVCPSRMVSAILQDAKTSDGLLPIPLHPTGIA